MDECFIYFEEIIQNHLNKIEFFEILFQPVLNEDCSRFNESIKLIKGIDTEYFYSNNKFDTISHYS